MKNKVKYLNGSVQAAFYGLRFRSNRLKHSVKRFDRFGLATLEDTFNFTIFSFVTVGNGSFFKIYSKSYSIEFVSFLYHFDDLFNSIKIVQWSQILYGTVPI